jgi:hypothetical protein
VKRGTSDDHGRDYKIGRNDWVYLSCDRGVPDGRKARHLIDTWKERSSLHGCLLKCHRSTTQWTKILFNRACFQYNEVFTFSRAVCCDE